MTARFLYLFQRNYALESIDIELLIALTIIKSYDLGWEPVTMDESLCIRKQITEFGQVPEYITDISHRYV